MLDKRSLYLRRLVLRAMKAGRRGHWGSSASLIEIMRVLYDNIAKYDPKNPKWLDRDRIILSKGHGVLAQAALLTDKGFFPLEELDRFCQKDGIIGGHPSPDHMPGVECHTGSLGHGMSIGVGMAIAAKIRKQKHRVFVIMGDGEIQEGSVWEAALCAAKHKLDNLTVIIDYNKIQSSERIENICPLEPLEDKWRAFGFKVIDIDGHNIDQLKGALSGIWWQRTGGSPVRVDLINKPQCILANTTKGQGISFAEDNSMWHYKGVIDDKLMAEMEDALG